MSSVFKFKQFIVDQEGSAMKINTDGVLLGALAEQHLPARALDIGTGTGVISMMLAQRYPQLIVDAVDVDKKSVMLSRRNVESSIFSDRISVYHSSFQEFSPQVSYDLIVSNPPFFMNALQNRDKRKSNARHTDSEFYDDLITKAIDWLNKDGTLQIVLPLNIADYVINKAKKTGTLTLERTIYLKSFIHSVPFRKIIFLRKGIQYIEEISDDFVLYESKGLYSAEYKILLQPFFLNF